ncbi:MAG: response regulator [Rhodocyclaceae bacterium]|nr:response regulator [Rhodocyclaceae bacterium]
MSEKRVLIIDDVSIIRAYVKAALKDEPVQVVEASTAQLGLDSHSALPADLIICDVNMPQMGGEAFLARLREDDTDTPVIMLTAEGDKGVVGNLVKLGIQGYLLKPFKPALLADRVRELIGPEPKSPGKAETGDKPGGGAATPAATEAAPAAPAEAGATAESAASPEADKAAEPAEGAA